MRKRIRVVLASVCAFALVGAFALAGCSSNTEQQAGETQKPAEEQAKSESHEAVELQLFAANSLSKAMDAVQELYTQDHTWVTFKDTQYLSSGELNEQLAGGAYADVLISASKGKMDDAVEKGYVDEATGFDMFKNDLVMVAGEDFELAAKYADQSFTLDDLATGDYTVAVGDASVPAGNYTNQALSTVGCFIDADGTGKDSAGTDGSYDGTPLEGKVNLQSSVGNVCRRRSPEPWTWRSCTAPTCTVRRREGYRRRPGRHAQEHHLPGCHLQGLHAGRGCKRVHRVGYHQRRCQEALAGVGLRARFLD